jgi:hypothetical protein
MANPLNRQSFAEVVKYIVDGCKLQASMKNNRFVRKVFTELQKLSKLKISCPMKKVRSLVIFDRTRIRAFMYFSGTVQDHKLDYY